MPDSKENMLCLYCNTATSFSQYKQIPAQTPKLSERFVVYTGFKTQEDYFFTLIFSEINKNTASHCATCIRY